MFIYYSLKVTLHFMITNKHDVIYAIQFQYHVLAKCSDFIRTSSFISCNEKSVL